MKFLIRFLLLNLLYITTLFCYADSNKNDLPKLKSIDLISSLLGHEYSTRIIEDKNSKTSEGSGLYFEEKGKFHINSFYGYETKDGPTANACNIVGDMKQLSNELLLLTQIEEVKSGEGRMNIVMSIKLINNKTLELDLIYPSHLRDFCGRNADMAIIGKYTKTK